MQKKIIFGSALVLLFLGILGGVYLFSGEEEAGVTTKTGSVIEDPSHNQNAEITYKYPRNSFANYIEKSKNSVLKSKLTEKDIEEGFCLGIDNANNGITVKCFQPQDLIDETGEFTEVLDLLEKYDPIKSQEEEEDTSTNKSTQIDPNFIDETKYSKETMASYIQSEPEIQEEFKGKKLSEEYCFENKISEKKSKIKCVTPSEFLNGEDVYFDRILDDVLSLERDDTIHTVPFEDLSETQQINVKIHDFAGEDYINFTKQLKDKQKTGQADKTETEAVSYFYELEGNYEESKKIAKYNCENYDTQCSKDTNLSLSGTVKDANGSPIPSATIKVLSDETVPSVQTDSNGQYQIAFHVYDFSKVRIKASKIGYSEGVIPLNIVEENGREMNGLDFVLNAPVKTVTLNNATKTFVGDGVFIENNAFIVQTEWNKYTIPFDSFVYKDKTPFFGEVTAFFFEFDKSSDIDTLLANDIFDDVVGYAGNLMKTFGMPYVLFVDNQGENIHILKSNPMILQSQIIEMEALYNNQDGIYIPLTEEDMQYLYDQSQILGGYPIDREFLINPDRLLVHFPAFWVFDQVKGVWENIGVKLLNTTGLFETIFYTLNDL